MAKKEFTYRGKTLADLKGMSVKEFAELLPSRQRRTIARGFTPAIATFYKNIESKNNVKTHCRDAIILPSMVGKTILVHSGNQFVAVRVTEEMLGHLLGEFALTRKPIKHSSPGVGATKSSAALSVR